MCERGERLQEANTKQMLSWLTKRAFTAAALPPKAKPAPPCVFSVKSLLEYQALGEVCKVPVLLEFPASSAPSSSLSSLVRSKKGKLRLLSVDHACQEELANKFNVPQFPLVLLLKDGDEVERWAPNPSTENSFVARATHYRTLDSMMTYMKKLATEHEKTVKVREGESAMEVENRFKIAKVQFKEIHHLYKWITKQREKENATLFL
ncbi:hypothetical protein BASA82_001280 [Batrachochytrium salamandrivorans]|nr:hypothetical protein BASA81_005190 [Batrachochytrium salamandrivorans]KAH9259207.1 hypothetical protein BASA82_001280 [Batrachochytrium salamandrivorans]